MAAGPGRDRDQPVRALFHRLAGEAVVDHVVQRDPAPAVDRRIDILARAERGDDERHLPLGAGRHVGLEPIVRAVDDLVDRKRRGRPLGVRPVMRGERLGDPVEPLVELALRPGVKRGEAADDSGGALRDHQFRPRNDEHRRGNHRERELLEARGQRGGDGHRLSRARR